MVHPCEGNFYIDFSLNENFPAKEPEGNLLTGSLADAFSSGEGTAGAGWGLTKGCDCPIAAKAIKFRCRRFWGGGPFGTGFWRWA